MKQNIIYYMILSGSEKMNKEDKLVNCKNCKHFEVNKVNKDSTLFFCKLNKKNFRDENQISSNLNCYKGK